MNDLQEKFGSSFRQGTVVFREGDLGDCMYIIQEGEVTISKKGNTSDFVLAVLKTGEFFGEMSLFTEPNRVATATVSVDSVLLKITKSSFDYMVQNNVPFAIRMIEKLCHRLKKADEKIGELLTIGEQTRTLQSLMDYWKMNGKKDASGTNILVPYQGFLEHAQDSLDINSEKTKSNLLDLRKRSLIHVKKDTQGAIYISLSPRVFSYFNIL